MNENSRPDGFEALAARPSAPRRRGLRILIPVCSAVLVLAVAAACYFLFFRKKQTPLERSLLAVVADDGMPLDKVRTDAGRFVLTLDQDLLGKSAKEPLTVSGNAVRSGKLSGISLRFGTGNTGVSGNLLVGDDALYLVSKDLLGDKSYRVTLSEELLRASFLNPEKGGNYALSQEDFDSLCKIARAYEKAEGKEKERVEDALTAAGKRLKEVLKKNLKTEKGKKSVLLIDQELECDTVTYTLDHIGVCAVFRALQAEWKERGLGEKLKALLPEEETGSDDADGLDGWDADVDVDLSFDLYEVLDQLLKSETHVMRFTMSYATKDKYFVRGDIHFTVTERETDEVISELQAKLRFPSAPATDRRADASLSLMRHGVTTFRASVSYASVVKGTTGVKWELKLSTDEFSELDPSIFTRYSLVLQKEREDDGAFTLDASLNVGTGVSGSNSSHSLGKLHLAGYESWKKSQKCLSIEVTSLTLTAPDEDGVQRKVLNMTSSSFLLEIGGKRERVSVKKTAELLEMTDAEVQTLAADVLARIDEPFTKISEESGVLKRTKVLTEQARLKVGYLEEELMAWDCTTDRFYLVRKSTATRKMSVQCYSSAGKLVNERAIEGTVASLAADGGRVAYTLRGRSYQVHILNGETLEVETEVEPSLTASSGSDYLSNLVLDGDRVIATTAGTQNKPVVINWRTGENKVLSNVVPSCVVAYDRQHRVYAMLNQGVSRTEMLLYSLDDDRAKVVSVYSGYAYTGVYFDGTSFQACEQYISETGTTLKKADLTPNRPHRKNVFNYGIVYCDSELFVLQYAYRDGTCGMEAFSTNGSPIEMPAEWMLTYCFGRKDNRMVVYDAGTSLTDGDVTANSVVFCRVQDTWVLDIQ